jgi:hypothetical protein
MLNLFQHGGGPTRPPPISIASKIVSTSRHAPRKKTPLIGLAKLGGLPCQPIGRLPQSWVIEPVGAEIHA